jgi:multiple sugar transport system permease protein
MSGYLMQLPALVVLTVFLMIPIVASVVLAFTKYDLLSPPEWNDIANFRRLLTDRRLWLCFRNTVAVAFGGVIGNNVLGLLLAMGANRAMPRALKYALRAALFFPVLTTASSLAMVWSFLFASDRGALNWVLGQIGIEPIRWLNSSRWALRSVTMYQVWRSLGVTMIIYLAGLQSIPAELYEAGRIDGADSWRLMRHITLPLLTPTAFFSVVMGFIAGFQVYEGSAVLTGGGPGDASRTIAVYLYELAFRHYEMGYGAAVASVLLFLLVGLTMLQFWAGNRWVYYE